MTHQSEDGLVRVQVRLSKDLHHKMITLIPWGMRRNLMEVVLQLVLDAVEQDGMVVAGAILDGNFKLVRSEADNTRDLKVHDRQTVKAS